MDRDVRRGPDEADGRHLVGERHGLEAEARECIGEDTGTFDRDSRNTFLVDPNIADQDTTTLTPDMLTPDRPLVSSPVM